MVDPFFLSPALAFALISSPLLSSFASLSLSLSRIEWNREARSGSEGKEKARGSHSSQSDGSPLVSRCIGHQDSPSRPLSLSPASSSSSPSQSIQLATVCLPVSAAAAESPCQDDERLRRRDRDGRACTRGANLLRCCSCCSEEERLERMHPMQAVAFTHACTRGSSPSLHVSPSVV